MKLPWQRLQFNIICFPKSANFSSTPPPARSCRSAWGLAEPRPKPTLLEISMNQLLEDLIKVMTLERIEINLFRGESRDIGSPQVFGGQVLGQALVAATATAENRLVHSLHAYFLRRGDCNSPIVYEVDRAWDGKHFSTRRVIAIQHGQQIFNLSASFQLPESGLDHQIAMPDVPGPEGLPDMESQYRAALANASPAMRRILEQKRPFESRAVQPHEFNRV